VTAIVENLSAKLFADQLHTEFNVCLPDSEPLPLRLYEVTEENSSPKIEQFSLLFRGPLAPHCTQGIHSLQHDKLGELSLFLVPIGPDGEGMRYQAIFSRLREETK
jgi:hypothetical protein